MTTLRHQPKARHVCAQLSDLAHRLGPDARLPTIVEMRREMGVSLTTLSSALGELEARQVIYRVHGVGIFVSPQIRRSVVLLCAPHFFATATTSPFWNILVEEAERRAALGNESFSLHFATPAPRRDPNSAPLHEGLLADIRAGRVHGIGAVGLNRDDTEWIEAQGAPVVAFAAPGRYAVNIDNDAVARLGTQALQAQGCRRIGFWRPAWGFATGAADAPSSNLPLSRRTSDEAKAFRRALRGCKLPFDAALVRDNRVSTVGALVESHQEQGYRAAFEVFGGKTKARGTKARRAKALPDGLVISDDMMTHGALVALQKLGVRVGRDIQIATHSNRGSMVLLGREDELTRLEIDPAQVAQTMFETLEKLMIGESVEARNVLIKPILKPIARPHAKMTRNRTTFRGATPT